MKIILLASAIFATVILTIGCKEPPPKPQPTDAEILAGYHGTSDSGTFPF